MQYLGTFGYITVFHAAQSARQGFSLFLQVTICQDL